MDSITHDEFIRLFHRLAQYVRLGRVRNPKEILQRIRRILNLQRKAIQKAKRGSTIRKFMTDYRHLRTLYRKNIHIRIWNEAADNPEGLIDLTLDHGYPKARRILEERERSARRGRMRRLS